MKWTELTKVPIIPVLLFLFYFKVIFIIGALHQSLHIVCELGHSLKQRSRQKPTWLKKCYIHWTVQAWLIVFAVNRSILRGKIWKEPIC